MCINDSVGIKVQYVCYMVINLWKTWYCLFVYQHNEKCKDLLTDPITWFLLCDRADELFIEACSGFPWGSPGWLHNCFQSCKQADELFTNTCSGFPWGSPGWLHNASNHVREQMNYSLLHVQAFYEDLLADSILISLMWKRWCIDSPHGQVDFFQNFVVDWSLWTHLILKTNTQLAMKCVFHWTACLWLNESKP